MMIREPAVAGMFYPRHKEQCLDDLRTCLERAERRPPPSEAPTDRIIGGVVPHAGWICSGAVAGQVIREIARRHTPQVAVVFGAVHVPHVSRAAVFPSGAWDTPLGLAEVDARLVDRICGHTGLLECDPHAHDREHSIEVEVPFIQHLLPQTTIVPIMVPVAEQSAALGGSVGQTCRAFGADCVFLCSTDLTHYGPSYGFTPKGVGESALKWAKEVNDRRMVDLMLALRDGDAVEEAIVHRNACGGGAIAATLAACKAYGARRSTLLNHTTSHEVLSELGGEPARDAVGYAGILVHE